MTFLPIVERELRVATRKRFTYWLRVMAAAALLSGNSLFGPQLGGRMFALFHFTLLLCIWVLGPRPGAVVFQAAIAVWLWLALEKRLRGRQFPLERGGP